MDEFTFTIAGDTDWKLMRLSQLLQPASVAAFMGETVDHYLRDRARQRFENEGDDASGKWKALTEATQTIRAQMGYGASHPINVRTGELRDYVTGTPSSVELDPVGATLTMPGRDPGNTELAKKYRVAQQGDRSINTPARPVLTMNERDMLGVMSELEIYIRSGMIAV